MGVILLTLLAKRFPFFNSADDIDATIEMSTIFGRQAMKQCASLHGLAWESNIPTIGESGYSFEKVIGWSVCREKGEAGLRGEEAATEFLGDLLKLNPGERSSASQALRTPFLSNESDERVFGEVEYEEDDEEVEDVVVEEQERQMEG